MIFPEELIWLENWELLDCEDRKHDLEQHDTVVRNCNGVTMDWSYTRNSSEGGNVGLDLSKRHKCTFFEFDEMRTVSSRTFRVDEQWR